MPASSTISARIVRHGHQALAAQQGLAGHHPQPIVGLGVRCSSTWSSEMKCPMRSAKGAAGDFFSGGFFSGGRPGGGPGGPISDRRCRHGARRQRRFVLGNGIGWGSRGVARRRGCLVRVVGRFRRQPGTCLGAGGGGLPAFASAIPAVSGPRRWSLEKASWTGPLPVPTWPFRGLVALFRRGRLIRVHWLPWATWARRRPRRAPGHLAPSFPAVSADRKPTAGPRRRSRPATARRP